MSNSYEFECTFCKMNFGSDVIKLAEHIRDSHDLLNRKNSRKNEVQ